MFTDVDWSEIDFFFPKSIVGIVGPSPKSGPAVMPSIN